MTGTVLLVLLSIIGSLHKKDNSDYVSPKKTDRLIKDEGSGSHKSENKKTDEPFDFEDAERRIAEMRKGIEEVKKRNEEISAKLKIQTDSKKIIPLVESKLKEIKKHDLNLENGQTPKTLKESSNIMIRHFEWFSQLKDEYPGAPWLLKNDPYELIKLTRIKYNQMLLRLATDDFNNYSSIIDELVTMKVKTENTHLMFEKIDTIRSFADTKASNTRLLFDKLNDLHNKTEDIFANQSKS